MNRDGTPETELEAFLLSAGLGAFVLESNAVEKYNFTRAQVEVLQNSLPEPETDPIHNALYDYVLYSQERGDEP